MKRVAIIGTGISGLTTAHLLQQQYDLTIFDGAGRIGGHSNTIDFPHEGKTHQVDTGFIVFNRKTYPNFCGLLAQLGVEARPSTMTFSLRDDANDLEYLGGNLNGLFAQRRNIVRPQFWHLIKEIVRFYRVAPGVLVDPEQAAMPLARWLQKHDFGSFFVAEHLLPMIASIWSAPANELAAFPVGFLVRFLSNHGMLQLQDRPQWYTVQGGSRSYVQAICSPFADRIRHNTPVRRVVRAQGGVKVHTDGGSEWFDEVVIAAHADQALAMLADASAAEADILSAFPYQPNTAVVHTDESCLPRRRSAWAAWNYYRAPGMDNQVSLTYHCNILQGQESAESILISLNPKQSIHRDKIFTTIPYAHPAFNLSSPLAQSRHGQVSGRNKVHFCGAYWGYGFHEDGVNSALAVAQQFGIDNPFTRDVQAAAS